MMQVLKSAAEQSLENRRLSLVWAIALLASQIVPGTAIAAPRSLRWRGVSLAGAEFGTNLPGVYGTDYIYPNQQEVKYYKRKGMNIVRLPFAWERLQPKLYQNFDTKELRRLKTFVERTTDKGVYVMLDPHNYARYHDQLIGTRAVPNSAFANLWGRLARTFRHNPRVLYGLMNEPHTMPTEQWINAANTAIRTIRRQSAPQAIFVQGNEYSGAWTWHDSWYGTPNAIAMQKLRDPAKNLIIEVHQYMDEDGSGRTEDCVSTTIGAERLRRFTRWLRIQRQRGFLGEFSAGRNQKCYVALRNMVRYVERNADVWAGWAYWAGGPWWGDFNSIEPEQGRDKPQMDVLEEFL